MGVRILCQKNGYEKRLRREEQQGNEEVNNMQLLRSKSNVWQVEGNDDILFEVLKHMDAKTLASASCVNRRWRKVAEDEALWEGICTRYWPGAASRPRQLKTVVGALGGFRRLYALCLRPLLSRSCPHPGPSSTPLALPSPRSPLSPLDNRNGGGRQWSKDEVHLSLSLFSIDCYERLGRRICTPSSLDLLQKASAPLIVPGFSSSCSRLGQATLNVR